MPRYTVDLHNHTPVIPTDYRGEPETTPRQIVETALERGIDVWGIADHFTVEYGERLVAAAAEVARETGRHLLVIPGAEVRVRWEGEEFHLVCLFPPVSPQVPFGVLLGMLGLPVPAAPLERLPFLHVDRDPRDVARMVTALGGVCHIGHVDRWFGEYCLMESDFIHEVAESPYIAALEFIEPTSRAHFREGLRIACVSSSDSHSLEEIGRRTSTLEMPELSFAGLRHALQVARGEIAGVVAAS